MKKIKSFFGNNWFKIILAIVIILIGISVFYYFVIFLPQKEQTRLEQQRQEQLAEELKEQEAKEEELQNKMNLEICISDVEVQTKEKTEKLMNAVVGTQTSTEQLQRLVDDISRWAKEEKDRCFKKYPQK